MRDQSCQFGIQTSPGGCTHGFLSSAEGQAGKTSSDFKLPKDRSITKKDKDAYHLPLLTNFRIYSFSLFIQHFPRFLFFTFSRSAPNNKILQQLFPRIHPQFTAKMRKRHFSVRNEAVWERPVGLGGRSVDGCDQVDQQFVCCEWNDCEDKINRHQQQLAGILLFTVWHFTQISSVSLQPSLQRGQHQKLPVKKNRQRHQAMATQPIFFLGMLPVSLPQVGQGDPSPPPWLPRLMIMGPCWAGAGGGGQQAGGGGAPQPGGGQAGCPYMPIIKQLQKWQLNPTIYCGNLV